MNNVITSLTNVAKVAWQLAACAFALLIALGATPHERPLFRVNRISGCYSDSNQIMRINNHLCKVTKEAELLDALNEIIEAKQPIDGEILIACQVNEKVYILEFEIVVNSYRSVIRKRPTPVVPKKTKGSTITAVPTNGAYRIFEVNQLPESLTISQFKLTTTRLNRSFLLRGCMPNGGPESDILFDTALNHTQNNRWILIDTCDSSYTWRELDKKQKLPKALTNCYSIENPTYEKQRVALICIDGTLKAVSLEP